MSWDNSGAEAAGDWGASGDDGAWKADNAEAAGDWGAGENFGDQDPANVSKHAGDVETGGNDGEGCRNCGQSGHFARECPEPRKFTGECFNCGETGHNKADCPKPRVFKGTCRICEKEGHPASECPEKPADQCKNCRQEGHKTLECKNNRFIDYTGIEAKTPEEAWKGLEKADAGGDLDDVRDALQVYYKAVPFTSYAEIEQAFRDHQLATYLIAREKSISEGQTIMDLQGRLGRKYQIGLYRSPKPRRAAAAEGWPPSPEENMERLLDAGVVVDRLVPLCSRCRQTGHISKNCQEEKTDNRPVVKCANCNEEGHRVRDCPKERVDQFACRNCKQPGHTAAECTEPRSAEGVECKNCNETGHFARDCPKKGEGGSRACRNCGEEGHMSRECDKPRNPDTVQCRNCDQMGHFSRDCPEPKNWSKVQCKNCGEMGHTIKRCPTAPPEENKEQPPAGDFGSGWEEPPAQPVASQGDWDQGASGGGAW